VACQICRAVSPNCLLAKLTTNTVIYETEHQLPCQCQSRETCEDCAADRRCADSKLVGGPGRRARRMPARSMIECQKLLRLVLEEGKFKSDRTGTGTEMSNSRSDPDGFLLLATMSGKELRTLLWLNRIKLASRVWTPPSAARVERQISTFPFIAGPLRKQSSASALAMMVLISRHSVCKGLRF